jgi:hypothetical protein
MVMLACLLAAGRLAVAGRLAMQCCCCLETLHVACIHIYCCCLMFVRWTSEKRKGWAREGAATLYDKCTCLS